MERKKKKNRIGICDLFSSSSAICDQKKEEKNRVGSLFKLLCGLFSKMIKGSV